MVDEEKSRKTKQHHQCQAHCIAFGGGVVGVLTSVVMVTETSAVGESRLGFDQVGREAREPNHAKKKKN